MYVIAEVADGVEVVQKAETLRPDLIVLDLGLPNLDGIAAIRQIQLQGCHCKILILTNEASDDIVEEAFRLGALGYVLKTDAVDLAIAIDCVLRGEQFVSGQVAKILNK